MNLEILRSHCLALPFVEERFPFGPEVLVFMINNKMFALVNLVEERLRVNLKCDPDYAITLRDEHEEIIPGWHMNKKHWITVYLDGSLKIALVKELILNSYDLVKLQIKKTKKQT
ncbi:MAG: MmcQ/YjbR family DNA-binding protein [Saprospiraceae bacterium]|jgi:predicted DNA-binding protein (MmcQ/YjbR family)|nr:MmcQ/YjbR family DNA-binding protein [Saprospiraceae bacterium]MBK6477632.1 MmcQ/YjbR family DNA-binding protein [Saprospiraceae bacterium]MBK6816496.1 MmcQ/YjbR family DNA-binding protein [Saprospiraceae bacterium]MBK7371021.1 MmcQ/YjbR family DNA-binding protein [Saprospiraceae bacterium]MBK7436479.1 MmcQ/YjbR family DNA-binding protein [Saprospiraceae bacterium]